MRRVRLVRGRWGVVEGREGGSDPAERASGRTGRCASCLRAGGRRGRVSGAGRRPDGPAAGPSQRPRQQGLERRAGGRRGRRPTWARGGGGGQRGIWARRRGEGARAKRARVPRHVSALPGGASGQGVISAASARGGGKRQMRCTALRNRDGLLHAAFVSFGDFQRAIRVLLRRVLGTFPRTCSHEYQEPFRVLFLTSTKKYPGYFFSRVLRNFPGTFSSNHDWTACSRNEGGHGRGHASPRGQRSSPRASTSGARF